MGKNRDNVAELTQAERARLRRARERGDALDVQVDLLLSLYARARTKLAAHYGITDVAAMETAADELLATMQRCMSDMGGRLRYTLHFKDAPPLEFAGLSAFGAVTDPADDAARARLMKPMPPEWQAALDGPVEGKADAMSELAQLDRLRELYRAARIPVAAKHGIADIPVFEEMADDFIDALRESISEMNGELIGLLVFKDHNPIEIEGIADLGTDDHLQDID